MLQNDLRLREKSSRDVRIICVNPGNLWFALGVFYNYEL